MYQEWKDNLKPIERKLLNYIYSYWKKNFKWPENIEIKMEFIDEFQDGTELHVVAEGLGYVFVQYNDSFKFTRLSILGMGLCDDSDEDISIYLKIVRYLSEEFFKDREKLLTIKDIQKHFNFSDNDIKRVCELFRLAPQLFRFTDDCNFTLEENVIIKLKNVKTIDDYYMKIKNNEIPARFLKDTIKPNMSNQGNFIFDFDEKTLDKIADIICGDILKSKYCEDDDSDCPFYRKGSEISRFFQNAGLECEPHDGSTRKWWALELLKEYNNDSSEIEKILLRLASPLEYNGKDVTETVIEELNDILFAEGYKIKLNGVAPSILKINSGDVEEKLEIAKNIPTVDFSNLVNDKQLSKILEVRWNEVKLCMNSGAYLAAIILLGSVLEGVLLATVENNLEEANSSKFAPNKKRNWTLNRLINVAHELEWMDKDIKEFNGILRNYRNFIHPNKQREDGIFPDNDTCKICVEVVLAALNDLGNLK